METAIGVFDSRERAEQAVKELIERNIPESAIIFLTGSESEALSFGKDLGKFAGGFIGGAVGTTAGCVGAALALIPGFGQVFALGVGGAALLGYLGSRAGGSIGGHLAQPPGTPKPTAGDKAGENAAYFLEVLKHGRSLVLVQTQYRDVAAAASGVLDKLGLGKQAPTTSKAQYSVRNTEGVTIVDLRGKIAFGEGNTLLRETISRIAAAGGRKVLLNLREVDFVDSSGIGELVRSHMALRKLEGHMKLSNLSKVVSELMQATSLNKVFEIYVDEESALNSFGEAGRKASTD